MKNVFQVVMLACFALSWLRGFSQIQGSPCCFDCTCVFCSDIANCVGTGLDPYWDCSGGGSYICGNDLPSPCNNFWDNNTQGVQSDIPQPTDPNGCIPIDGGLGFLIAGGLGIGVVGIRRRKEQLLLKRA